MLRASHLGGMCLGPVNTAAVHALAYPLGGEFHVAHGVANSLLLPHVLRFNVEAAPARYAEVARALGVDSAGDEVALAAAGSPKSSVCRPPSASSAGSRRSDQRQLLPGWLRRR